MTYHVIEEKTAHGRAWVVVKNGKQIRLFFDKDRAEEYAEKMNQEDKQRGLF